MIPVYSIAAVREMERAALLRRRPFALMRAAGVAVAAQSRKMTAKGKAIKALAIAGPGNNGGDALVAAAELRKHKWQVDVILCQPKKQLPPDAAAALRLWQKDGGKVLIPADMINGSLDIGGYDIIIDGIFGIGGKRPLGGDYGKMAQMLNAAAAKVIAIDVPSGINADSGGGEECIMATQTITFFAAKAGLYTGKGIAAAGEVAVCTLGGKINAAADGMVLDSIDDLPFAMLRRRKDSHKGDYGSACLIGGAAGMTGALALASRACVRLGAGKVAAVALAPNRPAFDTMAPEVMWQSPPVNVKKHSVIGIGVGLANNAAAKKMMAQMTASILPLVVDADGLNILAADSALRRKFCCRKGAKIITPHPAEAARLLECTTAQVQSDRIAAAKMLAQQTGAQTLLKGAGSVMASPDGEWMLCGVGNAGLAQGGSGDVLTGMIVALLAQSGDVRFALNAGCYLHSAAADVLARDGYIGMDITAIAKTAAMLLNAAI